jgi:shikimate kinase
MRRSLALGGFAGSGKTSVGRALAARAGVPFLDLDEALADRWGPIAAQFADVGEARFRARESEVLGEVLAGLAAGGPGVLATGGGTWVSAENRLRLAVCWRVVLRAPLAELRRRVGARDPTRPLWDEDVEARLAAREEAYSDADLLVDTAGRPVPELAEAIAAWWSDADSAPPDGYQSRRRTGTG